MKPLILIGYWSGGHPEAKHVKYPDANELAGHDWPPAERAAVMARLLSGTVVSRYRGLSNCRVCDCYNGSTEMSDGIYVWPSGLAHYVLEHSVRLPEEFVKHCVAAPPMGEPPGARAKVDDEFWCYWGQTCV